MICLMPGPNVSGPLGVSDGPLTFGFPGVILPVNWLCSIKLRFCSNSPNV